MGRKHMRHGDLQIVDLWNNAMYLSQSLLDSEDTREGFFYFTLASNQDGFHYAAAFFTS